MLGSGDEVATHVNASGGHSPASFARQSIDRTLHFTTRMVPEADREVSYTHPGAVWFMTQMQSVDIRVRARDGYTVPPATNRRS